MLLHSLRRRQLKKGIALDTPFLAFSHLIQLLIIVALINLWWPICSPLLYKVTWNQTLGWLQWAIRQSKTAESRANPALDYLKYSQNPKLLIFHRAKITPVVGTLSSAEAERFRRWPFGVPALYSSLSLLQSLVESESAELFIVEMSALF